MRPDPCQPMFTKKDLETKSGPELVTIFNSIPGVSRVKRFSNRDAGIRRILATQSADEENQRQDFERSMSDDGQTKSERAMSTSAPKKRGRKKAERGIYNEPLGPTLRTCRPNSGRGRLLELTLKGATFAELREALPQWTEDQLHRHIRNQHFYLGYRLTTNKNGVIRAHNE